MKPRCTKVFEPITAEKEKGRASKKLMRGRMEIV
jgi:hypothetical protein